MLPRRLLPFALVLTLLAAGCVAPAAVETPAADVAATGATHVFPGEYVTKGDFARVLVEGALAALPQEHVLLESALDGASMEIGLVRPDTTEPAPVIVFASPYLRPLETLDYSERLARLVDNFVPHGYAVALVPIRGTANNGGCMDLMGPKERADLDQAVTWLGEQEWSNGRIGMLGVSYDGSTPWMVASMGNPYLKTIVPISGVNDAWHLMYRNGTPESRGLLLLNALYYEYGFVNYNVLNGRSAEHSLTGALCPESWKGLAASVTATTTGERDPLGFWAARNLRPGVEENYNGSIFHVQGLQDWNVDPMHNVPWVLALEEKGFEVKHLYGQWGHQWPDSNPAKNPHARWDWAEILLRWFDRELKGLDVDTGPRVQVESSDGRWRSEEAWPPADAVPVTFRLGADGALTQGDAKPGAKRLAPPCVLPAAASALTGGRTMTPPPACPAFATEALTADLRFAGMPTLPLDVTPLTPYGHVAATLWSVEGDAWTRLGWGQIDLRFAEGGEKMKPVVPGQKLTARLQLEPLDALAPAGSKLVVTLHQWTYADHVATAPAGVMDVHVGGDAASALGLLAFARGDDAFFTPPGKKAPEA